MSYQAENSKGRKRGRRAINEDTPLTQLEMTFIDNYLETSHAIMAYRNSISAEESATLSDNACRQRAYAILKHPNVRKELREVEEQMRSESVASIREVMEYFTSVMRGQEKDQFGLDASIADRTVAAKELAKRYDILNSVDKKSKETSTINVKLDWGRD